MSQCTICITVINSDIFPKHMLCNFCTIIRITTLLCCRKIRVPTFIAIHIRVTVDATKIQLLIISWFLYNKLPKTLCDIIKLLQSCITITKTTWIKWLTEKWKLFKVLPAFRVSYHKRESSPTTKKHSIRHIPWHHYPFNAFTLSQCMSVS